MQLTESVFTPERQQINTVRRAHLCLTGKPSSWAKGANEPAREGKGRWQPHPWGRGGLVHQEVLLWGQIAEGWQAGGFTEPYFFFFNRIKGRRGRGLLCRGGRLWDAWLKAELRALLAPGRGKAVWATSWGRYHFRPRVSRVAWLLAGPFRWSLPTPIL